MFGSAWQTLHRKPYKCQCVISYVGYEIISCNIKWNGYMLQKCMWYTNIMKIVDGFVKELMKLF